MEKASTESTLGRVLLLVSGILSALAAFGLLVFFTVATAGIGMAAGGAEAAAMSVVMFLVVGLTVAGAVVSFKAWSKAASDPRKAGILGIVATFLPPTNIIALVGGILLLVSPEAKAQQAARTHGEAASSSSPPAS